MPHPRLFREWVLCSFGRTGRAGIKPGTIIAAVNGVATPTLDTLVAAMAGIPDGDQFTGAQIHIGGAVPPTCIPWSSPSSWEAPILDACVTVWYSP